MSSADLLQSIPSSDANRRRLSETETEVAKRGTLLDVADCRETSAAQPREETAPGRLFMPPEQHRPANGVWIHRVPTVLLPSAGTGSLRGSATGPNRSGRCA